MNTRKLPLLVVDARLINTSGIGTVIQNTLPFLFSYFRIILLGNPDELFKFSWAQKCRIINFTSPIYSLAEQIGFVLKVPACDYFLSPHYNVPLFRIKAKNRIVIIHDVNHVALGGDLSFLKRSYARFVINKALQLSDKVFTVSNFSKSEIIKYFKFKEKEIVTLPLGVDRSVFQPKVSFAKETIQNRYGLPLNFILYVGNVKPHKNLKALVQAFGLLKSEHPSLDYKLVIVGKKDGFITADNYLFKLIDELDLTTCVIFTGFVSQEDLPLIFNLADLFVFPSLYEGFGLPPLEAMACGCPTLVAETASLPEVCQDAVVYFDPAAPRSICEKMYEVISNNKVRQGLKEKGLALAQTYNWKNTASQLINHLLP